MTVSDQIIKVLDDLCEKFGFAIDWTGDNVIPYLTMLCTKLVSYEIWTSVAWIVIVLIGFAVALLIIRKHREEIYDACSDDFFGPMIIVFSVVICGVTFCGGIVQIMDIIKCVTFPELFVFEYVKNLIENAS